MYTFTHNVIQIHLPIPERLTHHIGVEVTESVGLTGEREAITARTQESHQFLFSVGIPVKCRSHSQKCTAAVKSLLTVRVLLQQKLCSVEVNTVHNASGGEASQCQQRSMHMHTCCCDRCRWKGLCR